MSSATSIEDINTFVDALRYSQTLVNTAEAGVELSYDFLKSYDYYGTVSISNPTNSKVIGDEIAISGYNPELFYQYDENALNQLFFSGEDTIYGNSGIIPINSSSFGDSDLLTTEAIDSVSLIGKGYVYAETLSYINDLNFDDASPLVVLPLKSLQQYFGERNKLIDINNVDWDFYAQVGEAVIRKPTGSDTLSFTRSNFASGLQAREIHFLTASDKPEILLKNIVGPERVISDTASLPDDVVEHSNIFTLSKLNKMDCVKVGDTVSLTMEGEITFQSIKDKIDSHISATDALASYTGEDCYIPARLIDSVVQYIFDQITDLERSTIEM